MVKGGYTQGGDIMEEENSYYGFLLRFITDITGLFLRVSLTLNQDTKKSLETLIFEKKPWKIEPVYYGYYGILQVLQKSLLWNITEYYGL